MCVCVCLSGSVCVCMCVCCLAGYVCVRVCMAWYLCEFVSTAPMSVATFHIAVCFGMCVCVCVCVRARACCLAWNVRVRLSGWACVRTSL